MNPVFVALVIVSSLYFSMQGVMIATYVILALLIIHIIFALVSFSVIAGMIKHMLKNSDVYLQKIINNPSDPLTITLVRLLLLVSTYHIFLLGHVFFAGAMTSVLGISISASFLQWVNDTFMDKEDH